MDLLKNANSHFISGNYAKALHLYTLTIAERPALSNALQANINLCYKRIYRFDFASCMSKTSTAFMRGHSHSSRHGAVYFPSTCKKPQIRLASGPARPPNHRVRAPRVVFVADSHQASDAERKVWGAETSADFIVTYGKRLGHNVATITPGNWEEHTIQQADLLVIRSISSLSDNQERFLRAILFEDLKLYATYQHDYAFCTYRNSIRCNGIIERSLCQACLASSERFFDGRLAFYTDLLSRAALNIFISHPQRHMFACALGGAIDPSLVILPPVDPNVFRPMNVPRDRALIVCTAGKLGSRNKGFANIAKFIERHPQFVYHLYTAPSPKLSYFSETRNNVRLMDPIPHTNLPLVYSRAHALLALPSVMEPAGRTPIEAALCGCRVISNNNLGVNYFHLPLGDRQQLEMLLYKSLDTLWGHLASIANRG
jgi:glycosyltransferase involved in cell wall biosynthesis